MTRTHTASERPRRHWWQLVGIVAAAVLVGTGLAVLAIYLVAVISLNSFGNNK
jgi:predicted CDP-diglyceride synthetase/phosphatidate cytidylyltransferase